MTHWKAWIVIFLAARVLCATAQEEAILSDLGGMMKEMTAGLSETGKVSRVDAGQLQSLLPAVLPGFRRVETTGGSGRDLAAVHSTATGRYEGRPGARIEIEIRDHGTNGARTVWTRMGFDPKRSKSGPGGVDRTWVYLGRPAVERYVVARKSGEIHVLSGGRFVVRVTGTGVDPVALHEALKAVDLAKLDGLPVPAATVILSP